MQKHRLILEWTAPDGAGCIDRSNQILLAYTKAIKELDETVGTPTQGRPVVRLEPEGKTDLELSAVVSWEMHFLEVMDA